MDAFFSFAAASVFLTLYLFKRQWLKQHAVDFAEELEAALDRFRGGGPPTPMHPSPAGDDAFLRRRRS